MSDGDGRTGDVGRADFDEPFGEDEPPDPDALERAELADQIDRLERDVAALEDHLEHFERSVEDRTVKRPNLEAELRRYVRERMRRSRARGWGPYLVLLYGTIMTLGAFYYLGGGWSILAMIVVWLSTLGLYVVMVAVGAVFNLLGIPSRLWDRIGKFRS